jgi:hypothetical protein
MIEVSGAALAGHSFLRGMPRDQLSVLAEVACDVKFPARYRLFEDGGNATCFWLIQPGHVTLTCTTWSSSGFTPPAGRWRGPCR